MAKYLFVCDPPPQPPGHNTGGTHQVVSYQADRLKKRGDTVVILSAEIFGQVPKGQSAYKYVSGVLDGIVGDVDFIHIATCGLVSFLARRYCVTRGLSFTTAHHTRYPELLRVDHGFPLWVGYKYIKYFHRPSGRVIVPTPSMETTLKAHGVKRTVSCLHGVDTDLFRPRDKMGLDHLRLPRPYWLYVGRVSQAKNVPAFLALRLPGTKIVVGDGPLLRPLKEAYPDAYFAGVQKGESLAAIYDAADVFVLPSLIETFGLVLLEALAAGLPVAASPTEGPVNVVTDPKVGCLDNDLGKAAKRALELCPKDCRRFAEEHSWDKSVERFSNYQVEAGSPLHRPIRFKIERRLNLPVMALEPLVGRTESMLFGAEAT